MGALNGDTVKVGVFSDFLPGETYGRVIDVVKRVSNLTFVCEVCQENSDTFYPIDTLNPGFVNFPGYSGEFRLKHGYVKEKYSRHGPVIVYSIMTTNEDGTLSQVPRVADIIDHNRALNMAFVVKFVKWNPRFPSAFGIVIKAYPKGYSYLHSERLLSIIHSVNIEVDDSAATINSNPPLCPEMAEDVPEILYKNSFTVDPKESRNLDDALTLCKLNEPTGKVVYQFGVHIVNAAKHVKVNSRADNMASSKGTALYYKSYGKSKMVPMLPYDVLNELSLTPDNVRDVWSVICQVHVHTSGEIIRVDNVQIHPSQICSILQLSYEDAQEILNGSCTSKSFSTFDDSSDISLRDTLGFLYRLSLFFAKRRLKSDAVYWYNCDSNDDQSCWQPHKMIAEFMIWANNEVSKKLYNDYPSGALLRCQRPPEENKLVDFQNLVSDISMLSYNLSKYSQRNSMVENFMVLQTVMSLIRKKRQEDKPIEVASILMSDCLYPQLSVASSRKKVLCHKSKYCITEVNVPRENYQHYDLCLETYTHFTSPLRRYADILVQRLLQHSGEASDIVDDSVCRTMNDFNLKASNFEKSSDKVNFSLSMTYNSEYFQACIEKKAKSTLVFSLLDIKSVHHFPEVRIRCLGPFMPKNSKVDELENLKYSWRVRVSSLTGSSLNNIRGANITKMTDVDIKSSSYFELHRDTGDEKLEMTKYKIDFKKLCVSFSPKNWINLLEFTKEPSIKNFKYLDFLDQVQPKASPFNSCDDIHVGSVAYPFMSYIFSLSLEEADVFNVWLCMRKRKCLPESVVQVIELSPLFRVCVQHNSHPAHCFSDFFLQQASRQHYKSINEYTELWQKVLLAEAAVASVFDSQIFIVRDVSLKWPNFNLCPASSDCSISYVVEDPLELEIPKAYTESMLEYFNIKTGDFICARYGYTGDSDYRRVFHFVIKDIKRHHGGTEVEKNDKDFDTLVITMDISRDQNKVSRAMKFFLEQSKPMCEIQIINMSRSHRRVYESLLKLNSNKDGKISNSLVNCVAVNPANLQDKQADTTITDTIIRTDPLALGLWNTANPKDNILNHEQVEAIRKVKKKKFQLIRGPPGTGKSVTGAHISYIFAMQNRQNQSRYNDGKKKFVLYCGPSNKSVDVVFEKFCKFIDKFPEQQISILRIYGRIVESNNYSVLPESHLSKSSNYHCPEWGKPYSLHHLIRDRDSTNTDIMNFLDIEERMMAIKKSLAIPSAQFCREYRKAQGNAEKSVLEKGYDVVLCTCNEVSGFRLKKVGKPSQCIIDEAGMASEPETLMPISHCEHVVLIGDHAQLQPVIKYRPASNNGLSISLFQRYATNHDNYMCGLREQYRMHEAVCKFPSDEFYDGELRTAESVLRRKEKEAKLEGFWPAGSECPIVFCDIIGEEDQEETGIMDEKRVGIESKYNLIEAKKAVEVVQVLCSDKFKVGKKQVAILTPYTAQKVIIQKELKKVNLDVKVATISDSQGDEYGFVIFSVVRSKPRKYVEHEEYICPDQYWMEENLGFVTNKHQINVGITRSKYGLIIIGNRLLLRYNSTWKNLISHYDERHCVVDEATFPPR